MSGEAKDHPFAYGGAIGGHALAGLILGAWARQFVEPCRYHHDPTYTKIQNDPNDPNFLRRWQSPVPDDPGSGICGIVLSGPPEFVGTVAGLVIGLIIGALLYAYYDWKSKPSEA